MWLWERTAGLIEIFVGCNCSASPQWSTSPKRHPFLVLFPSSISFHTGTKSTSPVACSLTSFHSLFTDVSLILVKPNSFKYSQIFPKIRFSSTVALAYNNHSRKLIFISSFQHSSLLPVLNTAASDLAVTSNQSYMLSSGVMP